MGKGYESYGTRLPARVGVVWRASASDSISGGTLTLRCTSYATLRPGENVGFKGEGIGKAPHSHEYVGGEPSGLTSGGSEDARRVGIACALFSYQIIRVVLTLAKILEKEYT